VRRVLAVFAVLVAAGALAFVAMGAKSDGGGAYKVRAIFDNAGFVIPGEDVKVAGVKVGTIDSLDVTKGQKAAVVLNITDPGFQDFRQDASCIVRPQSLIGERFVECSLTQKRAPGAQLPPPLKKIQDGPGKGEYYLSVQHTSKTVDIDLIGDIAREPERQRLSLILNELGTGLAGRGKDLNDVIKRADPALKNVDDVLQILASQNRTLQQLAKNSDTVLAPLARDRVKVASAIANSNKVAAATASRRGDLEADIQRLPAFLTQLKPTMTRLGALSDEMTPVLNDLDAVAPQVNRLIIQLGPFSQAATPAVTTLGQAAEVGTPAVIAARPVIAKVRKLANVARPVAGTLADVLESFQRTHGIERLMDYTFYQVSAINGFDSIGHYLRAGLIVNSCSTYSTTPVPGCSARFPNAPFSASSASAASAEPHDKVLQATAAALAKALGTEMAKAKAQQKRSTKGGAANAGNGGRGNGGNGDATRGGSPGGSATTPSQTTPSSTATPAPSGTPGAQPVAPAATPGAPAPAATPAPSGGSGGNTGALLDYLFGKDG
jgi:phospholipid/cholesterol/gamma-HCH transport system substrate-binding protein